MCSCDIDIKANRRCEVNDFQFFLRVTGLTHLGVPRRIQSLIYNQLNLAALGAGGINAEY